MIAIRITQSVHPKYIISLISKTPPPEGTPRVLITSTFSIQKAQMYCSLIPLQTHLAPNATSFLAEKWGGI